MSNGALWMDSEVWLASVFASLAGGAGPGAACSAAALVVKEYNAQFRPAPLGPVERNPPNKRKRRSRGIAADAAVSLLENGGRG